MIVSLNHYQKTLSSLCLFLVLFGTANQSFACLWDTDTLAMERQTFPKAHELLTGHFLRHSKEYYEWRVKDRLAKPYDQKTPQDYDDIAVAYDKLGNQTEAIKIIKQKMERWPNEFKYESLANLGTFLIHSHKFEEGLKYINEAIEINPNAHFGREVYQKLLVEYVLEVRKNNDGLPLSEGDHFGSPNGFMRFIMAAAEKHPKTVGIENPQKALKGILGMMRFGSHDSPILLEALGDILLSTNDDSDAKMLAARAYLKASYEVENADVSQKYREKAEKAIHMHKGLKVSTLEADLKDEIAQAEEYYQNIYNDEKLWIAQGKNLDDEFAQKYYEESSLDVGDLNYRTIILIAVGILVFIIAITFFVIRRKRSLKQSR